MKRTPRETATAIENACRQCNKIISAANHLKKYPFFDDEAWKAYGKDLVIRNICHSHKVNQSHIERIIQGGDSYNITRTKEND